MASTDPSQTISMTQEDLELLTAFAVTADYGFMQATCLIGFYGAYFVVFGMAVYALMMRLSWTAHSTKILFLSLLGTFIVTTLSVALFTTLSFTLLRVVLVRSDSFSSFSDRIETFRDMVWVERGQRLIHVLMGGADCNLVFIVNDSVAVWRALTLWTRSGRHYLGGFLHFLVFSNLVLYLASISIAYVNPDSPVVSNTSTVALLQLTGSVLGTLANVLSTFVFAYMSRRYNDQLDKGDIRVRMRKRLVLLTESGLLYAVLQVVKLVLAAMPDTTTPLSSPMITANIVWQLGGFVLGAMYTPTVVLIVAYKRSMAHLIAASPNSSRLDEHEKNVDAVDPGRIYLRPSASLRRSPNRDPKGQVYASA